MIKNLSKIKDKSQICNILKLKLLEKIKSMRWKLQTLIIRVKILQLEVNIVRLLRQKFKLESILWDKNLKSLDKKSWLWEQKSKLQHDCQNL